MAIQKFIVGLGNPENKYKNTRHNIGFEILNQFIEQLNREFPSLSLIENQNKKLKSKIVTVNLPEYGEFALIYPQTYMNLSGQAVRALIDWYKITDLSKMLIVQDDISLPLGRLKWIEKGGAGGQHGIESIIEHLGGNKDFPRLKFGIGPDPGGDKRSDYVLGKFPQAQAEILQKMIDISIEGIQIFLKNDSLNKIMEAYNGVNLINEINQNNAQ